MAIEIPLRTFRRTLKWVLGKHTAPARFMRAILCWSPVYGVYGAGYTPPHLLRTHLASLFDVMLTYVIAAIAVPQLFRSGCDSEGGRPLHHGMSRGEDRECCAQSSRASY